MSCRVAGAPETAFVLPIRLRLAQWMRPEPTRIADFACSALQGCEKPNCAFVGASAEGPNLIGGAFQATANRKPN